MSDLDGNKMLVVLDKSKCCYFLQGGDRCSFVCYRAPEIPHGDTVHDDALGGRTVENPQQLLPEELPVTCFNSSWQIYISCESVWNVCSQKPELIDPVHFVPIYAQEGGHLLPICDESNQQNLRPICWPVRTLWGIKNLKSTNSLKLSKTV